MLGDRWRLRMGVVCGDYAHWVHPGPPEPGDQPTCRGKDVARFVIHDQGERIRYDAAAILKRTPYAAPKHAGLFDVPEKVVLSGASGATLRAAVDTAVQGGEWMTVSPLNGVLICRYLGPSALRARRLFIMAWSLLRPTMLNRPACSSRFWNT